MTTIVQVFHRIQQFRKIPNGFFMFDSSKKIGDRLKKQLSGSVVTEKVCNKELASLLLPNINFIGDWNLHKKEQLLDLDHKYKSVFLTLKPDYALQIEKFVKDLPNVFIGGKAYAENQKKYEVVHGVRDGRNTAMKIHNIIQKQS